MAEDSQLDTPITLADARANLATAKRLARVNRLNGDRKEADAWQAEVDRAQADIRRLSRIPRN